MKERTKRLIALGTCAALLLGGVKMTSYADNVDKTTETKKDVDKEEISEEDLTEILNDKETIYVFAKADGSVNKVMAGSEVEAGEDAKKKDVKKASKALPIQMKISYQLDGKKIDASELPGKSGHLVLSYQYENKAFKEMNVNGKKEKMKVPFAVLTGALLDNEIFKNVEVSNGKIVDDGTHTMVAGFALPGLQDNLKLNPEILEFPETVTVEADVENCEMMETMTIATNEVFTELDENKMENSKDLEASLKQLNDAMEQLMDGSSALYDGLDLLLSKSGELQDGVGMLVSGSDDLNGGINTLDEGAGTLKDGIDQLYAGIATLESKNGELTGGGQQVFNSLLATANEQIAEKGLDVPTLTISNYSSVLSNVISSLDKNAVYAKAEAQVKAGVEANRDKIVEGVTQAVRSEVEKQVEASIRQQIQEQMPAEEAPVAEEENSEEKSEENSKENLEEKTQAAKVPSIPTEEQIQALIKVKTDEQMKTPEVQALIAKNTELTIEKTIADKMASPEIQAQLQAASEGAKSLISLKSSLDSYNAFYLGLLSYTQAVTTAKEGAARLQSGAVVLKDGTLRLVEGSRQLNDGMHQLSSQVPELIDGVTKLHDGSMQLSDGLKQFNEEGIKKITGVLDKDVKDLAERLKATVKAAKEYRVSEDLTEGNQGNVTFIYRTDEIK